MYEKYLQEGLTGDELEACMNLEYKEMVKSLLEKSGWETRDDVAIYQSLSTPHLWNIYDCEPSMSRPTDWRFNPKTETIQKWSEEVWHDNV